MNDFDPGRWFTFQGRLNRQPYVLTNVTFGVGLKAAEAVLGGNEGLMLLLSLATLIILVPVAVRRAHDVGKSGWFVALLVIPIVFLWPGLVLTFQKGTEGPNDYGEDPLGAAAPVAAPAP